MTKNSRRLKRQQRALKKEEIPYSQTVRYNLMMETQQEYGCQHNDLYCGYGRQPITQEVNEEIGGLEITVNCALSNQTCVRHWQKGDKPFDNQYCFVYRQYILGENHGYAFK